MMNSTAWRMQMIVADARGDTKQTNGAADVTGVWSVSGPKVTLTGDISGGAPVYPPTAIPSRASACCAVPAAEPASELLHRPAAVCLLPISRQLAAPGHRVVAEQRLTPLKSGVCRPGHHER